MIKWNEQTWYSRLIAIILFVGIIPALSFYLGWKYQQATHTVKTVQTVIFVEQDLATSTRSE